MIKAVVSLSAAILVVGLAPNVAAQPTDPPTSAPAPPLPEPEPAPLPPSTDPLAEPPAQPQPSTPAPEPVPLDTAGPRSAAPLPSEEEPEPMSEGRRIVSAYNSGFQWGIAPGVVFSNDKASFFLGLRFGYGFDTGKVILVPGVRLAGYFTDPNVYLGMPVLKLVYPIDRFAPFILGGAGVGYVSAFDVNRTTSVDAQTGLALLVGGGFMIHFNWKFGLGVEATYQTITGTGFDGYGIGPILALAF